MSGPFIATIRLTVEDRIYQRTFWLESFEEVVTYARFPPPGHRIVGLVEVQHVDRMADLRTAIPVEVAAS